MRTKLLALTYSAWSEAQFTQIVYTPNTFTDTQIANMLKDSGIFNKWQILINYTFIQIKTHHKVQKIERTNQIKNDAENGWEQKLQEINQVYCEKQKEIVYQKTTIKNYLENYVDKQSKVRNKIAHGQWLTALHPNNKMKFPEKLTNLQWSEIVVKLNIKDFQYHYCEFIQNFKINSTLTKELEELNVFSIMKEFEVHTILGDIIRHLVQSPNKEFNNNYYKNMEKLEIYLNKISNRNYESFKQDLEMKKQRFKKQAVTFSSVNPIVSKTSLT
ncbi:MAG: Unknown protein [uncultured Sulfurovum sp.]|uniref:Uncharacterized protein n=1 Tax=uncultured Sulfurovum sp. TaxID=269237 RepID=A0A6S6SJ27_9BACT|nr:MAG: Unknown protein [uncultured Sulfurovum sp.]